MRRAIGATAAAATIAACFIATSPADATTQPADVKRKSHKCDKPKGKRFNISWEPGMSSTTFYFNNHCQRTKYIKIWATNHVVHDTYCTAIKVKPGVRGHKKIWAAKHNIDMVLFGKCPPGSGPIGNP